ncbi:MAG: ThiF family adenylyltransferase [Bacteroidota bacterium]
MQAFQHELSYRTAEVMEKIRSFPVTICGAGALGANLTETLGRSGFKLLSLIDPATVEPHNLSTHPFVEQDIGAYKSRVVANLLHQAVGVRIEPVGRQLDKANVGKLLDGSRLVVDTFDNRASQTLVGEWCKEAGIPCLQTRINGSSTRICWSAEAIQAHPVETEKSEYPLARNLVLLTVSVLAEVIIRYVAYGTRESYDISLREMKIEPLTDTEVVT